MHNKLPFQKLQQQISNYIRDPDNQPMPKGVDTQRLEVYKQLLFNNMLETLGNAFPVCRTILPETNFENLVRDFFKTHLSTSPYFHAIPKAFVDFLSQRNNASGEPEFLYELAHYEWVELALEIEEIDLEELDYKSAGDLLNEHPVISPLAWILQYNYPVHKISLEFQPKPHEAEATFLAVYRNKKNEIHFTQLSALTTQLLNILAQDDIISGKQALIKLAHMTEEKDLTDFVHNGHENLKQLQQQCIILGTKK